jgi:electron transport complex protein RnfD
MLPALIASIIFFGISALYVVVLTTLFCVVIEYLVSKYFFKKSTITDLSAVVTGVLLAFNLPSNVPWWIMLIGAGCAIILGKMLFGGLGQNPFNPALLARVILLVSWPAIMTLWPNNLFYQKADAVNENKYSERFFNMTDVRTSATPLGLLAEKGVSYITQDKKSNEDAKTSASYSKAKKKKTLKPKNSNSIYLDLFLGNCGGSLGEVSALALLLGGIFLLYRGHITWHIPVSYILTVFLVTGIFWLSNKGSYADPLFHILSGGVMLGAIFMATDMVTTPITTKGMLIFGIGCGLITVIIRIFGAYPEGVSFSILFMNSLVPIIDKYTKPKRYGLKKVKVGN